MEFPTEQIVDPQGSVEISTAIHNGGTGLILSFLAQLVSLVASRKNNE